MIYVSCFFSFFHAKGIETLSSQEFLITGLAWNCQSLKETVFSVYWTQLLIIYKQSIMRKQAVSLLYYLYCKRIYIILYLFPNKNSVHDFIFQCNVPWDPHGLPYP